MNIVHVYKDYFPVLGGIENHIRQLAEAQAAQGHRVTALVTALGRRSDETIMNGVRVIKAGRLMNVQSAPLSLSFLSYLRRCTAEADIVHLHAPYPPGEAANLWLGRGRKTVITWHSDIVRQKTLLRVYGPILRRVLRRVDGIIPTSEAYARSSPWLQAHLDKCFPVPLGINAERFRPDAVDAERIATLRRRWLANRTATRETQNEPLIVLSVGRLRYYKGLDDLIRAIATVQDVIAVIVGEGPLGGAWRALAGELGVVDRVLFAGEVSDADLPAYYCAADVFVSSANARAEAFGIAILEAMACGLPAISTEVGTATSWINQHEITGLVTPARNPAALARAITTLRDDAERRRRMGRAARQRIEAGFTEQQMIAGVQAVYERVLSSASRV
ncbi:MAG: glycosyltransferase [Anaerolineae bacterium]|nr:glycosyltransferase [Thermoflexales bacterium]MDW8408870.1 glycosyltransferase [Anaerolineae bacterium]